MLNHPSAEFSQSEQRVAIDGAPVKVSPQKQLLHVTSDYKIVLTSRESSNRVSPITSWGERGRPDENLKAPPPPPTQTTKPHTLHQPGAMVVGLEFPLPSSRNRVP